MLKKEYDSKYEKSTTDMIVLIKDRCYGGVYQDKKTLLCTVKFLASVDPATGELSTESGYISWYKKESQSYNPRRIGFKPYGVYKVRLRKQIADNPDSSNMRYLLVKMVSKHIRHSELEVMSKRFKEPVSIDSGYGIFNLDRKHSWFHAAVDWLGAPTDFYLETDEEDGNTAEKALSTFITMYKQQEEWDKKIRSFAAEQLCENANDWRADAAEDGEEPEIITPQRFTERISSPSFTISPDGSFTVFFDDDDMFWGHSILVSGNISGEFDDANLFG